MYSNSFVFHKIVVTWNLIAWSIFRMTFIIQILAWHRTRINQSYVIWLLAVFTGVCWYYVRIKRWCQDTARMNKCFNTLRPRQNGRHFADGIFKGIFLNENVLIPIKFSMKFVPKGPINNIPALFQIMVWRRPGDKPLSEPMVVSLPTLGFNVLSQLLTSWRGMFSASLAFFAAPR